MSRILVKFATRIRYLGALLLMVFLVSPLAQADTERCLDTACFPERVEIRGQRLQLQGIALFEYWSFDVYTAALYTEHRLTSIDEVLADVPKYLVLFYHRSLEKQNIIDNSEYILKANPELNLAELRPRLSQLYQNYVSVEDGDRFAMSYVPGAGTTLYFNGKEKETFPGIDFQKAYFGIWLSHYSVGKAFTKRLLGL